MGHHNTVATPFLSQPLLQENTGRCRAAKKSDLLSFKSAFPLLSDGLFFTSITLSVNLDTKVCAKVLCKLFRAALLQLVLLQVPVMADSTVLYAPACVCELASLFILPATETVTCLCKQPPLPLSRGKTIHCLSWEKIRDAIWVPKHYVLKGFFTLIVYQVPFQKLLLNHSQK